MKTEEETSMQTDSIEPKKETPSTSGGNENFVVLDMAGDSEDSDKDDKSGKDTKEKTIKLNTSDIGGKATISDSVSKPGASNTRLRKKPKAPVVDVNSLRKRKWQLKVYPLHAEDLQLNYMSILCKLASESLLYIPSEGRHGKAELYVATQKETAAIIGKLLRMGFHHKLLSIEVVRKDTGGKEDGDESKKECKAFLMFDKFLSKKIFDAKGEKGMLIEKIVTLNKLPKAATKDFIGALFPFATEIEIIESDNPDERKATVKCKTPVTSLLVYKSFKRLEINDVHVKLTVDDSVKAITLPPMFFIPPPEKKDTGPPDSMESLNQSSLPRRPMMTSLTRRVQQIKKRALLTRKKPTRGQIMRGQRPNQGMDDNIGDGLRGPGGRRSLTRRGDGRFALEIKNHGPGSRDYPGGPGRRRMNERQNDRRNRERDSRERNVRRTDREESQVTKEMLQLQNQLNQAIKNQIAMLSTAQTGGGHLRPESFPLPGASHRASLLGHGPRHFGAGADVTGMGATRGIDNQHDFGGASSWSGERGGRNERDRVERERVERLGRSADRMDRPNRPERGNDRGKHIDIANRLDGRTERGSRDRSDRNERTSTGAELARQTPRTQRQVQAFGSSSGAGDAVRSKDRSAMNTSHSSDSVRGSSRGRRGPEYSGTTRSTQRNDGAYNSGSHAQSTGSNRYGDYTGQVEGDGSSYYRRY